MHVLGRHAVAPIAYLLEQAFAFVLGVQAGLVSHLFHGSHSVKGHLSAALNLSEIMHDQRGITHGSP